MPLIEPVALCPPSELGPVHFIGIGGTGMSPVAAAFASLGIPVSGSDQAESATLDWLRGLGIKAYAGHDPAQLGGAATVVLSSAIRDDNVELAAARARGLRVWHRSAALGSLMLGKRGIAVSGTHGKTTTTGMIAVMLTELGADPSYVLGAPLAQGQAFHLGSGPDFVIEADESDGSFLQYPAQLVVITNVEADHLDNWKTPEAYAAGFLRFGSGQLVEQVVLTSEDPGARALITPLAKAGKHVEVWAEWLNRRWIDLQVPGLHNQRNAAAAETVGHLLGYDVAAIKAALGKFRGTARRFETVAKVKDIWIVDDYAHHPTELRATLEAAREVTDGRIVACFQPHLFSRTLEFADEFGAALTLADLSVVLDIYPAREDPIPGVTGRLVADAARAAGANVRYVSDRTLAPQLLAQICRAGDLLITLGAGNVTEIGPQVASLLETGNG
jgi:UDP-N-acetylmuramate--alanine ligase